MDPQAAMDPLPVLQFYSNTTCAVSFSFVAALYLGLAALFRKPGYPAWSSSSALLLSFWHAGMANLPVCLPACLWVQRRQKGNFADSRSGALDVTIFYSTASGEKHYTT